MSKYDVVFDACKRGRADELPSLMKQVKMDVNAQDHMGNTLIHYGAAHNHPEVVEFLLTKKIRLNVTNNQGDTPLHSAAWRNNLECVKLLVRAGADVCMRNRENQTPLDLSREDEVGRWLLPADADELDEIEEAQQKSKDEYCSDDDDE